MKKALTVASILSPILLLPSLFWGYQLYLTNKEVKDTKRVYQELVRRKESEYEKSYARLIELSDMAKHPDPEERALELELLEKSLGDVAKLPLAIAYYEMAEDYLYRTQGLVSLYKGVESVTDLNPVIIENYDLALANYEKAKVKIDEIKEIEGDADFNFYLQYARGNIYYRSLATIAKAEEKKEFFDKTALAWERALDFRYKDQDTQANLEMLKNNQSSLLRESTSNKLDKLKQLPKVTRPEYSINPNRSSF